MNTGEHVTFYPPVQHVEVAAYNNTVEAGARPDSLSLLILDTHGQLFALHVKTQNSYDAALLLQAQGEGVDVTEEPERVFVVAADILDQDTVNQIVYDIPPSLLEQYLILQVED